MAISAKIPIAPMMPTAINWIFAKCPCSSRSWSTDESALRSALASLNDCGSSLHAALHFWTWVVVVGVALEMVSVVWEYCEELHDFNRGVVHAPERPILLLFAMGLLGAVLVAFGVTGEVIAEERIETLETCIRAGNDTLSLLLSKEASDANQKAGEANERASKNAWEAAQLRQDVETEKRARLTDAQKLEAEKVKRLELAASLLPRELDDQSGVIAKLKSSRPMTVVFEYIDEREPTRMAKQIAFVFWVMGWKFGRKRVDESRIRDGISISAGDRTDFVPNPPDNSPLEKWLFLQRQTLQHEQLKAGETTEKALQEALASNGIDATLRWDDKYAFPLGTLLIKIGLKPNPTLESTLNELGGRRPATNLPLTKFGCIGNSCAIGVAGPLRGNITDIPDIEEPPNKP